MANTTIIIKSSGVTGNVPTSLQPGELAINYADGKLYYGDSSNNTTLFDVITEPSGLNGEVQFNDSGSFGSSSGFTFDSLTEALTVTLLNVVGDVNVDGNVSSNGIITNEFLQFPDGTQQFSSAESASNYANAAFDRANTKVSKTGDVMIGDYSITGNMNATFVEVEKELFAGIATSQATLLPNIIAQFTSNSETYTQVNQQNINPNGSADFVVTADVGDDETFYIDMGINGSQFNDPENNVYFPLDSYLIVKGSDLGQQGGNLVIGTTTTTYDTDIKFIINGANTENVIATIDKTGMYVTGQFTSETTNTIGIYANSAFNAANTVEQQSLIVGSYANSAYDQANISNQFALSSGDYANSAYTQANTATTNAATADQKAASAGDYANSAYLQANTATSDASTANSNALIAGDYANSAFFVANTANSHSISSYDQANTATTNAATADQKAVSAGDYANSSFNQANLSIQYSLTTGDYANSSFDAANSKVSKSGDTMTGQLIITVEDAPLLVSNTTLVANLNSDLLDGLDSTSFANAAFANIVSSSSLTTGVYANAAFDQANTATTNAAEADLKSIIVGTYANSAYTQANTATTNASVADQKAVTSGVYANAAFDQANTATTNAAIGDQKAVTSGDYANSAFAVANLALSFSGGETINAAFDQANTALLYSLSAGIYANAAFDQANTATSDAATADQKAVSSGDYANSAFVTANSKVSKSGDTVTGQLIITVEDAPFIVANNTLVANLNSDLLDGLDSTSFANAAFVNAVSASVTTAQTHADAAYNQANTATSDASTADQKAVSAGVYANAAFLQANTATTAAAQADQRAVTSGSYANSAYTQANTATTNAATADQKAVSAGSYANSAYAFANTRYSASGGTIDGNVTITGNLNVTGNVVSHGADDLIINDPIVLLANNNTANTIDIGWVGHYADNGNTKHLGVIHHAANKRFYVFYDYEPHVQETNILDVDDPTFKLADLTANIISDVVEIRGYDPINHTNSAFSIANSAATSANTKVSKSGDTMTGSLTGVTTLGVNTITLEQSQITTTTFTTSSVSQVAVDTFSSTTYRSAKYYVQMTSGSEYHVIELSLLHDGTTVNLVQYGEIRTGASLGTFDASITTGTLSLLFTPTNATTTVKTTRMTIEV